MKRAFDTLDSVRGRWQLSRCETARSNGFFQTLNIPAVSFDISRYLARIDPRKRDHQPREGYWAHNLISCFPFEAQAFLIKHRDTGKTLIDQVVIPGDLEQHSPGG